MLQAALTRQYGSEELGGISVVYRRGGVANGVL